LRGTGGTRFWHNKHEIHVYHQPVHINKPSPVPDKPSKAGQIPWNL
jgi:hypothetical protein